MIGLEYAGGLMTGTGGGSLCGDFWKNYEMFVWIRDIGRGRLC